MKDLLLHQKIAVEKTLSFFEMKKKGILIFHALGSGKTIVGIEVIKEFLNKKKMKNVYILCPQYLFTVWKNELIEQEIQNFTLLNIQDKEIYKKKLKKEDFLIVDEAHILLSSFLRNSNILLEDQLNVYNFFKKAAFSVFMTATPIFDNLTDIYIWENFCSNKKKLLPTNDKNIFPDYYIISYIPYIFLNKIYPFMYKLLFGSIIYMTLSFLKLIFNIFDETLNNGMIWSEEYWTSMKEKYNDPIGRNIHIPLIYAFAKVQIKNNTFPDIITKDIEDFNYDRSYFSKGFYLLASLIVLNVKDISSIQKFVGKLNHRIKLIDMVVYSFIILYGDFRKQYLDRNMITKLNYDKFASKIRSIDKYVIAKDNVDFPSYTTSIVKITLNEKQTKKMVSGIVNKDHYNDCMDEIESELLCIIYNMRYNDVPMKRLLQIGNKYDTLKRNHLLQIVNTYKENIVISVRFLDSIHLLESIFKDLNISYETLYPSSNKESTILKNFKNSKMQILILHPDIIEGITVHNTKALILFDICTKYNIEQQVIGRCIRYKSHDQSTSKHVDVFKFVTVFNRKLVRKYMEKYENPNVSMQENLKDKSKYKFLVSNKTADEFYLDLNNMIANLYTKI